MADNDEFDECGREINRDCKYFHNDPDMTPNNYDLFFDYNSIPVNIPLQRKNDLVKELKKHLPLTKRIHLNMETETIPHNNQFNIYTRTKIIFTKKTNKSTEEVKVDIR